MISKPTKANHVQVGDLSPRDGAPGGYVKVHAVKKISTRVWITYSLYDEFLWTDDFDPDDIIDVLPNRFALLK